MKRKVLATTCSLFAACLASVLLAPKMIETRVLAGANADGSVTINTENFPDSRIMGSVRKYADQNNDWVLSGDELKIHELKVEGGTVTNFTGLEYFSELESIEIWGCTVNSFNLSQTTVTSLGLYNCFCKNDTISLSQATKLTSLRIEGTSVVTLDFSSATNLEKVYLLKTKISSLNLSGLSKLKYLQCENNMFESLDVSQNTLLETLECSAITNNGTYLRLTSLKVAGATSLRTVDVRYNDIRSLEFTNNPNLTTVIAYMNQNLVKLDCSGAPELQSVDVQMNKLKYLDVTNNTKLEKLDIHSGLSEDLSLGKLDLSKLSVLQELNCEKLGLTEIVFPQKNVINTLTCGGNPLTTLDLSNANRLMDLDCYNCRISNLILPATKTSLNTLNLSHNHIGTLDLTGASNLESLYCSSDDLSSLTLLGCKRLESLDCSHNSIPNLNLYDCKKLQSLYCSYNNIETLDLTTNTLLERFYCKHVYDGDGSNEDPAKKNLSKLTISTLSNLETFDCSGTMLKELDLSGCSVLRTMTCISTKMETLNLKNDVALYTLNCKNSQISALNLSGCTTLNELTCSNNKLRKLNLTGCTSLKTVNCQENELNTLTLTGCTSLESLFCSDNALSKLDVSGLTNLCTLTADTNGLTSLNLDGATALKTLTVEDNALTKLELSGLSALETLNCGQNRLTSFPTTALPNLRILNCYKNEITTLSLKNMPNLIELDCCFNKITYMDTTKNTKLFWISCYGNKFSQLGVSASPMLQACMNGKRIPIDFASPNGGTVPGCRYLPASGSEYDGLAMIECDKSTQLVLTAATPTPVTDKSVEIGKSFQYSVYGVSSSSIKWSVGNTAIATVSTNGTVTGKSYGNTYLYAALPNGSTIKCLVRVVYPALKINYTEKTLHINQTFQFSVSNAYGQKITWSVGNTSVATVDANGKVTGKSAANTYLYAKSADGRVAKCLVKIINPGTLGINYTEKTVYLGQTFTFTAKNKGILTPTWSVGNTAIAKVDSNGKVTPVKAGNTYLYVKTADGRSAKCLIKVVDPGPLSITYTEKTIKVGSTFQFSAKNPAGQKVTWRVGNTSVATVDANGKVTGKSVANTWLYASTPDGREVKCLLKIVA